MKYIILNDAWKINKNYNKEKLLYLLIDRPNRIRYNDFIWLNKQGQLHRNYDLPAVIWNTGTVTWFKNDTYYRDKFKPTIIY